MKTMKITFVFAAILILLRSYVPIQAQEVRFPFTTFTEAYGLPDGLATDARGNVYIHFEDLRSTELVQLNAVGAVLAQRSFGVGLFERTLFAGSRLSYDAVLDAIMLLTPEGNLFRIDPNGLQGSSEPVISIRSATVSTDNVYDVNTGQTVPFAFSPDTVRYSDLSLFRPEVLPVQPDILPVQFELIITGTSQTLSDPSASEPSALPFVMNLKINDQLQLISAQLVITSTATPAVLENRTRGVAVNKQGIGLTTLPVSNPSNPLETIEVAVMFPVGTTPLIQPEVLFDFLDLPSKGMTVDEEGNFYMASGEAGSSVCEPNRSGALIVIPVDSSGLPFGLVAQADAIPVGPTALGTLNQLTCFPVTMTMDAIVSSRDVAVSSVDRRIYITLNNSDQVLVASQP
jgi:hypothetical protein